MHWNSIDRSMCMLSQQESTHKRGRHTKLLLECSPGRPLYLLSTWKLLHKWGTRLGSNKKSDAMETDTDERQSQITGVT